MTCALRSFVDTGCQYRPDGQPDRAHWIPKQRLIETFRHRDRMNGEQIDYAIWDPRVWSHVCRLHHSMMDGPWFYLPYDEIPAKVKEYAREHDFFWAGAERGFIAGYQERRAA